MEGESIMNCLQYEEKIMKHFDRQPNDESAELMQHIEKCSSCREQFNQFKEIIGSLEQTKEINPPEDFEKAVMSKVHAYISSKTEKSEKFLITIVMGTLAILSVSLVVFGTLISNLNLFQVVLNIGGIINIISSLWLYISFFSNTSNLFSSLDFNLIKTVIAALFVFSGFAIASQVQIIPAYDGIKTRIRGGQK
jgi:hypothetical protein